LEYRSLIIPKGIEKMFEAVGFDDVNGFELLAEFSGRESLLLEPDDVGFGKIDEEAPCIFAEGHFGLGEFEQGFGIRREFFH
jgi:hypothetical protein